MAEAEWRIYGPRIDCEGCVAAAGLAVEVKETAPARRSRILPCTSNRCRSLSASSILRRPSTAATGGKVVGSTTGRAMILLSAVNELPEESFMEQQDCRIGRRIKKPRGKSDRERMNARRAGLDGPDGAAAHRIHTRNSAARAGAPFIPSTSVGAACEHCRGCSRVSELAATGDGIRGNQRGIATWRQDAPGSPRGKPRMLDERVGTSLSANSGNGDIRG